MLTLMIKVIVAYIIAYLYCSRLILLSTLNQSWDVNTVITHFTDNETEVQRD